MTTKFYGNEKYQDYLSKRISRLEEGLRDFWEHGTRFDLNPTGGFTNNGFEIPGGWHDYIKRMDDSVRERAHEILEKALRDD